MNNILAQTMKPPNEGAAPNTLRLRKLYNDYVLSTGSPLPFGEWVKQNFPSHKIIQS